MRRVTFAISDGSTLNLEVNSRFEQIVRERLGLEPDSHVSDADVKRFFVAAIRKASE